MHAFEKFPKIQRLRGLRMLVTEKIDGTNAQILVPDDPTQPVLVGSRNRWITPNAGSVTDNYDFASYVYNHGECWRRLGPGRHYGEWWGAGIGPRKYGLTERRFSLFNVDRYAKTGLPEGLPPNVSTVPILYDGKVDMDVLEGLKEKLRVEGSLAAPGFMNPEGYVVKVMGGGDCITWKFCFDGDAKTAPSPEEG